MPLVSVILPTCDRGHLLPRAIASVRAQTEPDWELLIVDNNCREPSLSASAAEWQPDPRIRVLPADRARNAAEVRNVGLAAARGEWISYLDDDDAYRPAKLAAQLELARREAAPLVLCGAMFHLRRRQRVVQCGASEWRGDDLVLRARWNTPLLFHRARPGQFFDESLSPGEDAEFAHRLLRLGGAFAVPVVPLSLVDIFPQPGARVNTNPAPLWRSTARILALQRTSLTRGARRRFILQMLLARAKLAHRLGPTAALACRLLRESRGADWRACANALATAAGVFKGGWVS